MIRNLLYSLCLHVLFLFLLFFNEKINNIINRENVVINTFNIDQSFLKNDIKTTEKDLLPELSLQEKIELYKLLKTQNNESNDKNIINNNNENIYKIINQYKTNKIIQNSNYVLYLGPTDYNRLINKQNKETLKENNINKDVAAEDKFENINNDKYLLDINIDNIFTKQDLEEIKKILKNEQNNFMLSTREKTIIQNQLISCYKNAIIQTGKNSLMPVSVTVKLFKDGVIDSREIKIKIIDNKNIFSQKDYNVAINNARIALAYCNTLKNLPAIKYNGWQNINFIFDATK